ncbi:MAG: FHA domain-containing protein [Candidatus Eisenbacteria bacterium]|uniref:FHA domain-containing protein n=1 Tax=Eiseniibacteriota bacterium TaxID=2212470 RepID=A0A933S8H1_UNCEI|nr:FHA domain-containing protein [Candidatus Eisenbacteria bacterium]
MSPDPKRPKVVKHCPDGHEMQMTWRTCPQCTGQEPELITNFRGNADATVMFTPDKAPLRPVEPPAEAAPPPRPKIKVWELAVTSGPRKGERIELGFLPGARPLRIGKAPKADPAQRHEKFEDSFMSREHVVFMPMGEAWLLQDLQSTNGTAVNGEKCEESWLRPGDEVRAGQSIFKVELVEKDAPQ